MGREMIIHQISNYIFAGYKFIYLYTTEELKTLEILKGVAEETETEKLYTFDPVRGLNCELDKRLKYRKREERQDVFNILEYISENIEGRSFVIFKDVHTLFELDRRVPRAFKNCLEDILTGGLPITLITISPVLQIPPEIEKDAVVIDIPLPTRDEIKKILEDFFERSSFHGVSEILKMKFIEALNGLTEIEARNIIQLCVQDGDITDSDINTVIEQKKQLIRKGGVLEFIKSEENMDDVGGLDELKKWLKKKKVIFDNMEKARDFNVDIPKGLLLFGMPGCGKSLAAKVTANYFEMPLLRLDMGMIMGPYVGQSEENMRKAIKLAESVAPSILWIDELEKAFAGIRGQGGGGDSSAISARIFGTILTWMQEKKKPVFVVATANSVTGMPPEFLRKGRFDEIFFVNFPKGKEIEEIIRVHLSKRNKKDWLEKIDLPAVVAEMEKKRFSGADIEAVIKEVIETVFVDERESVTTGDFINTLKDFKPLSETMKEEIADMESKAKKYGFKPAN